MPAEDSANTALCSTCRRPLTRAGPDGSCPRCLFGLALEPDGSPDPASDLPRYGQFEILIRDDGSLHELGAGAMGATFLAQDAILHRTVALKVIGRLFAADPAARARFLREARAAARLRHANIASVFHYGEQDGECFYAMELVEGETLEERVRRQGPLPAGLVMELAIQIARALAAAEAEGIVHRDLKPGNVMLTAGGDQTPLVKVIDFGLAKAASAEAASADGLGDTRGGFVGTPAFASPEQFAHGANERVDTRSDIYSLGVTLWYLLCGKLPFVGQTLTEIHAQQVDQPLPLAQLRVAGVPAALAGLLREMLAVAPSARPQSARELLTVMERVRRQFPAARRGRLLRFAAAVTLAAAVIGFVAWREHSRAPAAAPAPSVAVLPFENLSPDPADASFTAGIEDEITQDLARIDGLREVSAGKPKNHPPGAPRDLAAIGRELGVAHLLQGSVKRAAGQVDVRLSLTDLRDPAHPWTPSYHRPTGEILALRGEIIRAVSDRFGLVVSPKQIESLSRPPTHDPAAYDLYLRTNKSRDVYSSDGTARQNAEHVVALLDEAVRRDPDFTLAYCRLAREHDYIWSEMTDPVDPEASAARHRALAEDALRRARALEPDLGAVHLAAANHASCIHDWPQAVAEAELACRLLPNNPGAENLAGMVDERCSRWEQAIPHLERAVALDPLNLTYLYMVGDAYAFVRRDDEAERVYARLLDRLPPGDDPELPLSFALQKVASRGDLSALRAALERLRAQDDPDGTLRFKYRLALRLFEGDGAAAERVLIAGQDQEFQSGGIVYPKEWFAALAANLRGDTEAAQRAFAAARPLMEKSVAEHPRSGMRLGHLAMIDAALGHKEDAVREALRATEFSTYETNAQGAPPLRCNLAVVYAWAGQPDRAFEVLAEIVDRPAGDAFINQPTYGDFLLNPVWQSLRPDPRFQALIRKLAPRVAPQIDTATAEPPSASHAD